MTIHTEWMFGETGLIVFDVDSEPDVGDSMVAVRTFRYDEIRAADQAREVVRVLLKDETEFELAPPDGMAAHAIVIQIFQHLDVGANTHASPASTPEYLPSIAPRWS